MTKLLDLAVETARGLSAEAQDDVARVVLLLAGRDDEGAVVALTEGERVAIARSKVAAERGAFASDGEVQAVWDRQGVRGGSLREESICSCDSAHDLSACSEGWLLDHFEKHMVNRKIRYSLNLASRMAGFLCEQ